MDEFFARYSVISVGYVCSVPALILRLGKRFAAYAFDNMAIPMWAVAELLENDFDGFLANMEEQRLFEGTDTTFLTDSRYFARFAPGAVRDTARENALKRAKRLTATLATATEPVLFIRCEERDSYDDWGKRVTTQQTHSDKYAHDERYWIEVFSSTIKRKYPMLRFKILFMNKQDTFVDVEHNVVGIKTPAFDYRSIHIGTEMYNALKLHDEFLSQVL